MDHYAHSWKHISYPMTVKRVAEELSRTNLPLANRLFKAYNSERTLRAGFRFFNTPFPISPTRCGMPFRQGFYCVGAQVGKSIRQVMEESVDLVLFKVLMEEADGSRKVAAAAPTCQKQHSLEALPGTVYPAAISREKAGRRACWTGLTPMYFPWRSPWTPSGRKSGSRRMISPIFS